MNRAKPRWSLNGLIQPDIFTALLFRPWWFFTEETTSRSAQNSTAPGSFILRKIMVYKITTIIYVTGTHVTKVTKTFYLFVTICILNAAFTSGLLMNVRVRSWTFVLKKQRTGELISPNSFKWTLHENGRFCLNYKFWAIFNLISLEFSFQAAPTSCWKNKRPTKWMQQWYKGCFILCRRYKTAVRMQRYNVDAKKRRRSKRWRNMWHWMDETWK